MIGERREPLGPTIGRFSSLCSDVFRTVDRSSHAYSTALSTPPSQEGKNHPRVPGAPLRHPLSERKRRRGWRCAGGWMDGWGMGRGETERERDRRGEGAVETVPKKRKGGRGAVAISFVFSVAILSTIHGKKKTPLIFSTGNFRRLDRLLPSEGKKSPLLHHSLQVLRRRRRRRLLAVHRLRSNEEKTFSPIYFSFPPFSLQSSSPPSLEATVENGFGRNYARKSERPLKADTLAGRDDPGG